MNSQIPSFLLAEQKETDYTFKKGIIKMSFIDRTIKRTVSFIRESILQYETSIHKTGFQNLSAPAILIFYLSYIICISLTHNLTGHLAFTTLIFLIAFSSAIRLKTIYIKAFFLAFFFGFLVMLPACLNVFVPGKIVITLFTFQGENQFMIYKIPKVLGITYEGIMVVLRMFLKVFNSISLTFLVLYSISFDRLIRSLKLLHVPDIFILIITLSYKFIYTMALTVEEMFLALKSRWVGGFDQSRTRHIVIGRMGHLFKKSYLRYEEVYKAMISRGYTGEVIIKSKERISMRELLILILFLGIGVLICSIKI